MNFLDRLLRMRLEVLRIETRLIARYIDDVRQILEAIRQGTVIRDGELVLDQEQMEMEMLLEINNDTLFLISLKM